MRPLPDLPTQHRRLLDLGLPLPDLPEGLTGDLLAVHPRLVPVADLVPLLRLGDRAGFVVEDLGDLDSFVPAPEVVVPETDLYAVHAPERGDGYADLSPDEVDPQVRAAGRDGRERRDAPKLGWCWAGNRHTWLGIASVGGRSGVLE